MTTTANFRTGLCIEWNNDIYMIVQFQHVKPGKGGAFVRTRLKSLNTGKVLENTFNSGVKVQTARIERRKYQYLYNDSIGYHFMDMKTFEQINLSSKVVPNYDLMKSGQEIEIIYHVEKSMALTCELPPFVVLTIKDTEPGVKGDTVGSTTKTAILETNSKIQVPLFINSGEKIKIDTRTRSYSERVKG